MCGFPPRFPGAVPDRRPTTRHPRIFGIGAGGVAPALPETLSHLREAPEPPGARGDAIAVRSRAAGCLAAGWDYHRASVLIYLAGCQRRRLGELDTQAHAALDQAARVCAAHGSPGLLATIEEMRR